MEHDCLFIFLWACAACVLTVLKGSMACPMDVLYNWQWLLLPSGTWFLGLLHSSATPVVFYNSCSQGLRFCTQQGKHDAWSLFDYLRCTVLCGTAANHAATQKFTIILELDNPDHTITMKPTPHTVKHITYFSYENKHSGTIPVGVRTSLVL